MDFVYVLVKDGGEWEDIVIYLTEKDAIEASLKRPSTRIELFKKKDNGYIPTYKYFINGIIV